MHQKTSNLSDTQEAEEPRDEAVEVGEDCTGQSRQDRCRKRKLYLKTMLCCAMGFAIGFVSDNLFEFFLLLGLFTVFLFLDC